MFDSFLAIALTLLMSLPGLVDVTVRQVQCGASHSLAVTTEGRMYSWGKNSQGQCGRGLEDILRPLLNIALQQEVVIQVIVFVETVFTVRIRLSHILCVQVAAGWEHTLALTEGGGLCDYTVCT